MEFSYKDLCGLFDECFDDVTPAVELGYYRYEASRVLKEVDPIAYDQEVMSYIHGLIIDDWLFEHDDGTYHDKLEEVKE